MKESIFILILFSVFGCVQTPKTEQKEDSENVLEERKKLYYDNGNLKANLSYKDSLLHGINKWYHENGQIKKTALFYGNKKLYAEEFDTLGCKVRETRKMYFSKNFDTVSVGQEFRFDFFLKYKEPCTEVDYTLTSFFKKGTKPEGKGIAFNSIEGPVDDTVTYFGVIDASPGTYYYIAAVWLNCDSLKDVRVGTFPIKLVVQDNKSESSVDVKEFNLDFKPRTRVD